jgi:2-haloacid dehalogenase
MIHDDKSGLERRKFLAGLGIATIGGVAANIMHDPVAVSAKENVNHPSIMVFDVNGSLLDPDSMEPLFQRIFGDRLAVREWYAELALNSNSITLSESYPATFFELGEAVLKMMGSYRKVPIRPADIEELKTGLLTMPAFPDVPDGLRRLKQAGFHLVTLSNSPNDPQGTQSQLENAGVAHFFEQIFSTASVRRFKCAPAVYHMVAEQLHVPTASLCMISAHHWDAFGAQSAGYSAALLNRPGHAPLPLQGLPQIQAVAPDLPAVAEQLVKLWAS